MARRISGPGLRYNGLSIWIWIGLLVAALLVLAALEYLETDRLLSDDLVNGPFIFRLGGYANLLLAGSAFLYVAHVWLTSQHVGRWATGLAAVGGMTAFVALAVRWFETYYLHRPGHLSPGTHYEIIALFNVITVLTYLAMERIYRNRSAGAFVMMIVLAALLFQIWLAAHERAAASNASITLHSYWINAHVLGNFIGYAAFTVSAATAVAYLLHTLAPERRARLGLVPHVSAELHRIDRLMQHAILLGFSAFTLATLLGVLWAFQVWGSDWVWDLKETWALVVWLAYASYLWVRHVLGWSGARLAWWAIGSFGIAAMCLASAHVLGAASHSFGALPAASGLSVA